MPRLSARIATHARSYFGGVTAVSGVGRSVLSARVRFAFTYDVCAAKAASAVAVPSPKTHAGAPPVAADVPPTKIPKITAYVMRRGRDLINTWTYLVQLTMVPFMLTPGTNRGMLSAKHFPFAAASIAGCIVRYHFAWMKSAHAPPVHPGANAQASVIMSFDVKRRRYCFPIRVVRPWCVKTAERITVTIEQRDRSVEQDCLTVVTD